MRWRTLLYVPGVQERMLAKAPSAGADGLILDLEASVPSSEKVRARTLVAQAIPAMAATGVDVLVRLNTLASGLVEAEIAALAQPGLTGVVLPATESVEDIARVAAWLAAVEARAGLAPNALALVPILETARGIVHAYQILTASDRIVAALFGAEDFRQDMNVPRSRGGLEIQYARAGVPVAARAARVEVIDIVFTDLEDMAGLVEETRQGRLLGYTGKQVIHPKQIAPVHQALAPSGSEVDWARRVLAEAERTEAEGIGAFVLDGMMIDRPVIAQARRILTWAGEARDG